MKTNLFFAVELSEEAREALHQRALQWQASMDDNTARWYAPEDYHITLKFLGAHEPCEIDAFAGQVGDFVADAWRREAQGWLDIKIDGAGGFPTLAEPRVLWADVPDAPQVRELAAWINSACLALGLPTEGRPYKPHITLARMPETMSGSGIVKPPRPMFRHLPKHAATRFSLMQTLPPGSRKNGQKLRYNTVHTFDLVGGLND